MVSRLEGQPPPVPQLSRLTVNSRSRPGVSKHRRDFQISGLNRRHIMAKAVTHNPRSRRRHMAVVLRRQIHTRHSSNRSLPLHQPRRTGQRRRLSRRSQPMRHMSNKHINIRRQLQPMDSLRRILSTATARKHTRLKRRIGVRSSRTRAAMMSARICHSPRRLRRTPTIAPQSCATPILNRLCRTGLMPGTLRLDTSSTILMRRDTAI